MIDNSYRNSFKEVYEILENTDNDLLLKIPLKFIDFLKTNMNANYKTNIQKDIPIDKQPLLKETEAILSLIYRSYWATDKEKENFAINDNLEKVNKYNYSKDINQLFKDRKNLNNITLNNELIVVEKETFFRKLFNKILSIFKK